jgi:iron complex transport system substrate-binding protein
LGAEAVGSDAYSEAYGQTWDQMMVRLLSITVSYEGIGKWQKRRVAHSNAFLFVMRGSGRIDINGSIHEIDGNYVLHIIKGDTIRFFSASALDYYYLDYMFALNRSAGEPENRVTNDIFFPLQDRFGFKPNAPLAMYELLETMHHDWSKLQALQNLKLMSNLYQWIYEVLRQYQQTRQTAWPNRINDTVKYMKLHLNEPVTLEDLAKVAGCSVRYLNRLFQTRLNISPMQLFISIRMKRAMELLMGTDAALQVIAERTGYASGYSLSRHFKKYYGSSPQQYRSRQTACVEKDELSGSLREVYRLAEMGLEGIEATAAQNEPNSLLFGGAHFFLPAGQRRIQTPLGVVQVPEHPSRIVVDWELGPVLALGVTPLGSPHTLVKNNRLLHDHMAFQCRDIGNHNHIALEKVVEMEPDLIITSSPSLYVSYARIAPTVFYRGCDYASVAEQIHALGHILNRKQQADLWLHYYNRRSEKIREKACIVMPPNKTFAIMDPNWGEEMIIVGNTAHRCGKTMFDLLQQRMSPRLHLDLEVSGGGELVKSWNQSQSYSADYLLVMISKEGSEKAKFTNWEKWGAALNSQVLTLEWDKYFVSDPLSTLLQGEELLKQFC